MAVAVFNDRYLSTAKVYPKPVQQLSCLFARHQASTTYHPDKRREAGYPLFVYYLDDCHPNGIASFLILMPTIHFYQERPYRCE